MDHDVGIRQRETLAFGAGAKQHCSHARGHAQAIRGHVAREKLHRVVNGETGRDRATGRVDVNVDVLFGVLHLQEEQLRDNQVRDVIVDRRADENDAVFEQSRVNIVAALASSGLLHHHRNQHDWDRFSFDELMIFLLKRAGFYRWFDANIRL